MTKDEVLNLALEALHGFIPYLPLNDEAQCGRYDKAITAIKEVLAQQGRVTYAGNGTSGFSEGERPTGFFIQADKRQPEHGWTPERIAGMARLKEAQDKKMAQPEQPKVRTGNCLRVGVCASEGHKIAPQRTWIGLTPQERDEINEQVYGAVPHHVAFHHAIEAALKAKNT